MDALRKLLQLSESITVSTTTSPFPNETFARVVQLLGADDADAEVQKKAVLFLGNCALSPSLRRTALEVRRPLPPQSTPRPPSTSPLTHPQALPAVLKVLHSKNGAVVEAATYALINLSINCGASSSLTHYLHSVSSLAHREECSGVVDARGRRPPPPRRPPAARAPRRQVQRPEGPAQLQQ